MDTFFELAFVAGRVAARRHKVSNIRLIGKMQEHTPLLSECILCDYPTFHHDINLRLLLAGFRGLYGLTLNLLVCV